MGISTHVLDTSKGRPAQGIQVSLEQQDEASWKALAKAQTDADGRVKPLLEKIPSAGIFRIRFEVADYFAKQKIDAFYPQVTVDFVVQNPAEHFHVPLLLNPFGFSTYRGQLMSSVIRAEPLTPEAFAPFGDAIGAGLTSGVTANQGSAQRYDRCAKLVNTRPNAQPNLVVVRSKARTLPFEVKMLERHLHSSQTFLPLVCGRVLVIVAPARSDSEPELTGLRAFICKPGQGVSYAPGTWHHPIVVLDCDADLAMLVWEDGSAADCEERPLDSTLTVTE